MKSICLQVNRYLALLFFTFCFQESEGEASGEIAETPKAYKELIDAAQPHLPLPKPLALPETKKRKQEEQEPEAEPEPKKKKKVKSTGAAALGMHKELMQVSKKVLYAFLHS